MNMSKKIQCTSIAIFLVLISVLFAISGCSVFTFRRQAAPTDVYLEHVSTTDTIQIDFSEQVSSLQMGSIVSIISTTNLNTLQGTGVYISVYSGIILNDDGYVLASSQSAYTNIVYEGTAVQGEAQSYYAVLANSYNNDTHYKLNLIDYDLDAGLALFQFYDTFYYYTDAEKSSLEKGFQFTARFSSNPVRTGDDCVAIGNSLGNLYASEAYNHSSVKDTQLTVTKGIISDNESDPNVFEPLSLNSVNYNYILTSAPVNLDMIGGGLFDENGYIIGMPASKISTDSIEMSDDNGYISRVSIAYPVQYLFAYINNVSQEKQTVISYTEASSNI